MVKSARPVALTRNAGTSGTRVPFRQRGAERAPERPGGVLGKRDRWSSPGRRPRSPTKATMLPRLGTMD